MKKRIDMERKQEHTFTDRQTDRQTDYYNGLDLLKFFMAILIVMLHSFASKDGHPLLDFEISQCFTRVAVPFFFITSGFLLFRKMPLNLSEKDQKWLGLKDTFKF